MFQQLLGFRIVGCELQRLLEVCPRLRGTARIVFVDRQVLEGGIEGGIDRERGAETIVGRVLPARDELFRILGTVMDPEVPVLSVVDLGIVADLDLVLGGGWIV